MVTLLSRLLADRHTSWKRLERQHNHKMRRDIKQLLKVAEDEARAAGLTLPEWVRRETQDLKSD